jgi:GntR family transcriptional regulator/MocR family aminotransferase
LESTVPLWEDLAMPKPSGGPLLTALALDRESGLPLHRQLYLGIRGLIVTGDLRREARLPSSRTLSDELGLSRNTVVYAVEQLIAEGYLTSRIGAGTFVAALVPEDQASPAPTSARPSQLAAPGAGLSRRGRRIAATPFGRDASEARPFAQGVPAVAEFPLALWNRIGSRRARRSQADDLCAGDPRGDFRLREEIATYLTTARGVRCDPGRVMVVSSSQQAIDLVSRVVIDPGDRVWLENPGYRWRSTTRGSTLPAASLPRRMRDWPTSRPRTSTRRGR